MSLNVQSSKEILCTPANSPIQTIHPRQVLAQFLTKDYQRLTDWFTSEHVQQLLKECKYPYVSIAEISKLLARLAKENRIAVLQVNPKNSPTYHLLPVSPPHLDLNALSQQGKSLQELNDLAQKVLSGYFYSTASHMISAHTDKKISDQTSHHLEEMIEHMRIAQQHAQNALLDSE